MRKKFLSYGGGTYCGAVSLLHRLPHGRGTLYYPSGARYVGYFRRGKRHGDFLYTAPNGNEYLGAYSEGEFLGWSRCTRPDNSPGSSRDRWRGRLS